MSRLIRHQHHLLRFLFATAFILFLTSSYVVASPQCEDTNDYTGLVLPDRKATLLAGQPYNVTWMVNCFGWRCVAPGQGLVYLYLAQYSAPPLTLPASGGDVKSSPLYDDGRPVCINLSQPLLQIAYGAPNSGSFIWNMNLPDGIKSDHNYVVMGSIMDKDRQMRYAMQSSLFTIKRRAEDVIDESFATIVAAQTSSSGKSPQGTATKSTSNAAASLPHPWVGVMAFLSFGLSATAAAFFY